jgi:serine/threonine-protein kinase
MEYVEGVSLSVLLRAARQKNQKLPVNVIAAIVRDLLEGLHAAHELRDEKGEPLNVVHRDVSPQNLLVGVDGISRVVDFGVAKAAGRNYHTQTGEIRGKVGYMAPEQMFGEAIDRRVDVYATGVVLWEALAGDRLFNAPTDAALVLLVMQGTITPASVARKETLPSGLDPLIMRALAHEPQQRFDSAADMLKEFLRVTTPASREEVGQVVRDLAPEELALRASYLRQSSPGLVAGELEAEARGVLEVLTRATMSRDVVTGPMQPESRRYAPVAAVLGIVAALAAVSGVTLVRRARVHDAAAAGASVSATPSTVATLPDPEREPVPAGADSNAGKGTAPPPSSAGSVTNDPPSTSAGRPPRHKGGRPLPPKGPTTGAPPPPPPAPKPDCNPPYVTDADGNRHYKAECLK